ncbi:MAG: DUF2461 domain-containing protein [Sneathiella sp.]|nr:DUF2461 domain-containing protein [Sneathiella sp.]
MSDAFQGFPKDLLKFYEELGQNNDRSWFNVNKQRYKDVVVYPMSDFISEVAPHLEAIAPFYVADPRPTGGSMFRIYRDVRFSKNKTPYKEHAACQFRHQAGKDAHAPGFYLHIDTKSVRFGGGVWMPPSPKLKLIRQHIDENQDKWQSIITDSDFLRSFHGVNGDSLKRAPKDYEIDHPQIESLKKKSFFIMKEAPTKNILSKHFVEEVAETFQSAVPFMRFLTNAVGLPF